MLLLLLCCMSGCTRNCIQKSALSTSLLYCNEHRLVPFLTASCPCPCFHSQKLMSETHKPTLTGMEWCFLDPNIWKLLVVHYHTVELLPFVIWPSPTIWTSWSHATTSIAHICIALTWKLMDVFLYSPNWQNNKRIFTQRQSATDTFAYYYKPNMYTST